MPTQPPDGTEVPERKWDEEAPPAAEAIQLAPLLTPASGVPDVIETPEALARAVAALGAAEGPVAVDVERASGYRYGQRAYLVQLRRRGVGTLLIDPTAFEDLAAVNGALDGAEWVLHAASQDLPGLADLAMAPAAVFDTELAARLLGYPRVGLAAVVASTLGLGLAKEHSAADWSRRPLPESWLNYAALDVEVLLDVRDVLAAQLAEAGKAAIAAQEFEAIRLTEPSPKRPEPWRRTSGAHVVRDPRRLAIVRSLWEARDTLAREIDVAQGRVLPDSAIVAAAQALPRTRADLEKVRFFATKSAKKRAGYWWDAVQSAVRAPRSELPTLRGPRHGGPPPPRAWHERNPAAAARLSMTRTAVERLSQDRAIPQENLLQPDALKRVLWEAPPDVPAALRGSGARPWQVDLMAPLIEAAIEAHPDR
ncbi:MAG: HRDC domain-containing protein [Bifidobacteriaceae bacterium]|nr:HRDC domain-containing protein [Bifidobacteriaceae bacterium]